MTALILALILVLAPAGSAFAQEARTEGSVVIDASAEIIKGNLAQARQEALSAALRCGVEQAAQGFLAPNVSPETLRAWLTKPENYILSYRILAEGKVEQKPPAPVEAPPPQPALEAPPGQPLPPPPPPRYGLRVEVLVSLAVLKRDLRARGLAAPEEDVLPPVSASVEEAGGLNPARAQALLISALQQGGFKAHPAAGKTASGELLVAARLRLDCTGAGCRAEAALVGREGERVAARASGSATGQSAEEGAAGALKAAAASLAGQLREPVPVLLRLKGLRSYAELAEVKAALERMELAGRERSLQAGEVVLEVRLAGGAKALARRLAQQTWHGFSLGRPEVAEGTLTLHRLPPPSS